MSVAEREVVEPQVAGGAGLHRWASFSVCAGILVATIVGVQVMTRGVYLEKGPVALHKPLDELDKSKLGPYRVVDAMLLPGEIVEALGTKEYIQWQLEDTRRDKSDPLRYPILFVTYYTGGRVQVPHTPERCHLGANWVLDDRWQSDIKTTGPDGTPDALDVPIEGLLFKKPGPLEVHQRTVAYTFYANSAFVCDRNQIRLQLGMPGIPKSFFSKVEVAFAEADPDQAAEAALDVCRAVLPVLVQEHWPRPEDLQKDVPAEK